MENRSKIIVHPLIPLAVLKQRVLAAAITSFHYCAPTYTACGIETLAYSLPWHPQECIVHPLIPLAVLKLFSCSYSVFYSNCAPTYTACDIETTKIFLSHVFMNDMELCTHLYRLRY